MGNYVSITSSPSELINVADRLRDRGIALAETAGGIERDIRAHESGTFPSDQYTDAFVHDKYHQPVPGADGEDKPAHLAVSESGVISGRQLQKVGEYVSRAMVDYDVTDLDNAGQINTATRVAS
ncbi:hypothetical protein [Actinoplanes siamensis]|uniref:Uncharacterized protein n=1 Tax=Actinoplanes siamensis TaxID=1223317 RepID=A0A919N4Y5_9ACTN|nr:hypothetical protein [Actinoplanes siamensis]GIF04472.1 hypothetical protein Asi03nite_20100 [Actinoplanes siamensis]